MIKEHTVEEVERGLGVRIDFERLVKRKRLVVYDGMLRINKFAERPSIDRVELEWLPPLIYVTAKLRIGRYKLKILVLAFSIDLEEI
ncbi:MAG: hypothetical protein ACXQTI_04450 [Candidatus Nezhaarchaeales archaeon]